MSSAAAGRLHGSRRKETWMSQLTSLGSISAISLFVEDVPSAKTFYEDVFGVETVFEDDTSACVRFDGLFVNLLDASAAEVQVDVVANRDAGSRFQLSIWVDDVDAVCSELEAHGVTLLSGPVDREWGMRCATFADPAGHSWEVAQELPPSNAA
jgi:catechol 2,3-dioxygenase-like lactoylglutathione lyase family enzyme